jgi:hypothetical protein
MRIFLGPACLASNIVMVLGGSEYGSAQTIPELPANSARPVIK